jgi:hypothetical protein
MNVSQIASNLRQQAQNGQLVLNAATLRSLNDAAIAALPIDQLLSLLETTGLVFANVAITSTSDSVLLSGAVALLDAVVLLEATFQAADTGVILRLSAKLPALSRVPGASWLNLREGQLALQVSANAVSGSISGKIQLGDSLIAAALLVGQIDGEYGLQWTIAEVPLSAIAQSFLDGATMPPELPNLAFKDVETVIKPRSRTFSFRASSAAPLNFPANANGLSITQTQITVERVVVDATGQINCTIAVNGDRPLKLAEELTLQQFDLRLELAGRDWTVAGAVAAELFETVYSLAAAYSQTATEKRFALSLAATPAIVLLDLDETGEFNLSRLEVEWLQLREANAATQSAWRVAGDGTIAFTGVTEISGNLALSRDLEQTTRLVFTPARAQIRVPLPPDNQARMDWQVGEISFERRPSLAPATRSEWRFAAAVDVAFSGWHPTVHRYLPATIATALQADHQGARLIADRVVNPFDFVLPTIELDDISVELGAASIDVSDLMIQLGRDITLSARLGVGLPSELNNLFGTENGEPKLEFFNTFDPSDREATVVQAELRIGTAGIQITPVTSIIRAIRLANERGEALQPGEEPWWFCDLQEFGAVKFKVPVFRYDTTNSSFTASGAFDTVRPLSLPMTPAKSLLSACKLQGAADALPAGLPLQPVKIIDDQGNFRLNELLAALGSIGAALPAEVKATLSTIGDRLDQLPDQFKQYLNIEIPESFAFDLAVTPEGSVRFDARVREGDPPVKLLMPGMLGLVPVLNGVQLRRLSFGEFASGSLFLLQVDAIVDQFDLVTLATSALLPEIPNNPLPSTRSLQRRLILDDLFMVIIYQTVIPIPIPLFYDEIGIEYLGLEGIEFGTHAQFPMPTLDLAEAGRLLTNFKRFFSDRDFLLDPNAAPENLNLIFSLRKNFLQLPKYLTPSTTLLGDRQSGPEINAYQNLAHLLNGMKTLSVNELIQSLPLEQRVNSAGISFGPFSGRLGWLVTTPNEFRQIATQPQLKAIAYQRLGLTSDAQASGMLPVLPANPGQPNESGLVTFLRGDCAIANLASFETVFGLAASGSIGFQTGFRMVGKISNVMELGLSGRVVVPGQAGSQRNASDPRFQLAGQSYLTFLNQPIFQGDVQISDQRFQCRGMLNLYGLGGSVMLAIDRDQGAEIRGELNPIDIGVFKLSGANGRPQPSVFVLLRSQQVPILDLSAGVQLLGFRSETQITVNDRGFRFATSASLFNRFQAAITATGTRLNDAANFRVAATMQNDLRQFLKTEATKVIQQSISEAQAKITAQQKQVDDAQATVNSLDQQIEQQRSIVRNERATANRKIDEARQKVANEQARVNNLQTTIRQKEAERDRLGRDQSCTTTRIWVPKPTLRNPFAGRWENRTTCVPNPVSVARAGVLQGEITGLYTRLGTEQAGLKLSQEVLDKLVRGAINTPIDLDPRVSGLIGSRETASGVLRGYRETLEVTKRGLGAVGVASDFVARRGLDALLLVNAASFEADLNTASGGQVTMVLNITYQDRPFNLSLNFNFNNPLSSAQALGRQLISG